MVSLIAGILLLVIGLYGLTIWTRTDPKLLAQVVMRTLAVVALVGAAGALLLGRIGAAVPLAVIGFALLGRHGGAGSGWGGLGWGGLGGLFSALSGRGGPAPGPSRAATGLLEVELDPGSGEIRGRVLSGAYAGRELDGLTVPELLSLRAMSDATSLALLEAYLDRRAPAWREHAQGDAGLGDAGGAAQGGASSAGSGAMTEEEAYEVLGLEPGADPARVREAHRALMKKFHPDHGGSSHRAARINQAKDVILRRHR